MDLQLKPRLHKPQIEQKSKEKMIMLTKGTMNKSEALQALLDVLTEEIFTGLDYQQGFMQSDLIDKVSKIWDPKYTIKFSCSFILNKLQNA